VKLVVVVLQMLGKIYQEAICQSTSKEVLFLCTKHD
jgi:hypothetical protein